MLNGLLRNKQVFAIILLSLVGAGLFYLTKASPLAVVVVLFSVVGILYPVLRGISGGTFLVLLASWSIIIDDISQVAWGRQYEAFTEILGMTLFESVGITGLEFLAIVFFVFSVIKIFAKTNRSLLIDYLPLAVVSGSFVIASTVSLLVGLGTGGSLQTHFIQTRFIHMLPIWALASYVFFDRKSIEVLLLALAVIIFFKSLQAIFIFYTNPGIFGDAEYLVDHYFSMFSLVAFGLSLTWMFVSQSPLWMKVIVFLMQLPILWAFVLNDRRTAYVAGVFGLLTILGAVSRDFLVFHRRRLFYVGVLVSPILLMSVVGPGPLGFVRRTILSVFEESATIPSYRELENANLLNAVAQAPVTGLGTGKEFDEIFPMPDISFVYDRYKMIPHNLLLAGWAYQGPLGIASMGLIFTFMIAIGVRLLRYGYPYIGVGALVFFTQYLAFTYADLAFQIPRNQLFAGLLLGGCYRLLRNKEM
ncbi:MAG: hypothetical protein HRU19_22780 [Pseudobacteriovorax sp.]|nr:hypothetical protein [Pseudobacteriovorax sp.]